MSAEWCQHDPTVLHWREPDGWEEYPDAEGGKHIAVQAAFEGLTADSQMFNDWHKNKAGNIRLAGTTNYPAVIVQGPPCPWRALKVEGNHGWKCLMDLDHEFAPNQRVRFNLSNESKGIIDVNGWS